MAEVITRFKVESTQYERKIKAAGKGLDDFKKKGSLASDVLKQFESKLGVNITSLAKFGTAAGAVGLALKVAKDALMATEANMDTFRRETDAAKASYNGLLQALNTGNINGFLSNMGKIRDAARDAYNAADDLGTMTSFSDIDLQKIQTKRVATQLAIRQGKANGQDVKKLQDELLGYDEQIAKIAEEKAALAAKAYKEALRSAVMQGTGGRYDEGIARQYADSWEGFSQVSDQKIKEMEQQRDALMKSIGIRSLDNARRLYANGDNINREEERQALALDREIAIIRAIKNEEGAILEAKKNQVIAEQALQQAYSTRLSSQRYLADGSATSSTSTTKGDGKDYAAMREAEKARVANMLDTQRGLEQANAMLEKMGETLSTLDFGKVFPEGSLGALNQELAAANAALQEAVIGSKEWEDAMAWVSDVKTRLPKEGKDAAAAWSAAGTAMHGVGSVLASMDDPSAKILGLIAQGIASVASGAGQAMAAKDTTASGWAWIGAAAAITSEMVAIISTMKSATQYHADGGFVTSSGLARGTDTVGPVMLTPGELVLNRAQQTNLANQLGEPNQRQQVEFKIKDSYLYGILRQYNNKQSRMA